MDWLFYLYDLLNYCDSFQKSTNHAQRR